MTKVVITADGTVRASSVRHTGPEHRREAHRVMEDALGQCGLHFAEIAYVVATGYGRMNVPFADRQITELSCHARGVASLFPNVRLAIDIGGQDAKALKITNGKLVDFAMNDKCAAGTGRFLEVVAATLGLKVEELGPLSLKATKHVSISSTCTVFAQQEIVARLSEGIAVADVVAGLHDAVASRVAKMASRLKVQPDVVFTGGVAKNAGVVKALEASLGCSVLVPADPLLSGALGAALLARETALDSIAKGKPAARAERRLEGTTFFR